MTNPLLPLLLPPVTHKQQSSEEKWWPRNSGTLSLWMVEFVTDCNNWYQRGKRVTIETVEILFDCNFYVLCPCLIRVSVGNYDLELEMTGETIEWDWKVEAVMERWWWWWWRERRGGRREEKGMGFVPWIHGKLVSFFGFCFFLFPGLMALVRLWSDHLLPSLKGRRDINSWNWAVKRREAKRKKLKRWQQQLTLIVSLQITRWAARNLTETVKERSDLLFPFPLKSFSISRCAKKQFDSFFIYFHPFMNI